MSEICCGVVSESETKSARFEKSTSRAARRRRMEIRRIKFVVEVGQSDSENDGAKRPRLELYPMTTSSYSRDCDNAVENCGGDHQGLRRLEINGATPTKGRNGQLQTFLNGSDIVLAPILSPVTSQNLIEAKDFRKYGMASVCGRRRDMEDAVAIYPSFYRREDETSAGLHYFAVFDGHGCSHVATKCRDRMHELVKEELENKEENEKIVWRNVMGRSFNRMDKEVIAFNDNVINAKCRCELQTPKCGAVGSTAVVAVVTPDKIIVANCGDSRAVLCRNGKAVPLSNDHKPDRPDELKRIQSVGGRVIYWDGPRVLGVLAMSRAIGDNYLKPFVSCEPEVTITDRSSEDECLILASDGLWDVVSNNTTCGVARMCLNGKETAAASSSENSEGGGDKACSDASMLLTKLALARRSSDNVSVVVIDLRKDAS